MSWRRPPRRNGRMKTRRMPEHPVRVKVEESRGIFLDGYWRLARALAPHEGEIVEVSRLPDNMIEVRDDLAGRVIVRAPLLEGGR